MKEYLTRAEKIMARINELASISEDATGITRTFGTKAFIEGSKKVQSWMKEAGLETRVDNIGNVRGRLLSNQPQAKTFVIASHIDTVINAGKFDGPLGVVVALDLIEQLVQTKTALPFNIELMAFSDEEGVRYHTTYLGSKVVAGSFDETLLQKKDEVGVSLQQAIQLMEGDTKKLKEDALAKEEWLGYFEIHIEQGPVLYERDIPVAVVTGIAGQNRVEITFKGIAGHAGTVPMDMRNDALCCAAEFLLQAERYALINKNKVVATVGKLNLPNSASNVIPGEVVCTLDVRSADEQQLLFAYQTLENVCKEVCAKRSIIVDWNLIQTSKPVACDEELNEAIIESITASGYEVVKLVSGAGHDAVAISEVAPVSMMFVRCFKGISHNPLEDVEIKDIAAAIKVSDNFIQNLINKYNSQ
jgi:allantoate deiminase